MPEKTSNDVSVFSPRDNTRTRFVPEVGYQPEREIHQREVRLDDGPIGFIPIVGDVLQAGQAIIDLHDKKYGQAALGAGLLLLPNVAEKPIKQVLKSGAERLLRREPGMTLHLFDKDTPYRGTNFLHHGTAYSDDILGNAADGVLEGETRAMSPSFAVNRIGDFNDPATTPARYWDTFFIGDKSLLDDAVIYRGDGNTPILSDVALNPTHAFGSIPSAARDEAAERLWQNTLSGPWKGSGPTITIPELEYIDQPDIRYFEAKVHGTVPLDKMRHGVFLDPKYSDNPKKAEKVIQAYSDKGLPVSLYNGTRDGWAKTYLDILNSNPDILFKAGGQLQSYPEKSSSVGGEEISSLAKRIIDTSSLDRVKQWIANRRKSSNSYPTGGRFFLASEPTGNVPGTLLRVPTMSDIAAPVIESSPVPSAIPTERVTPLVEESAVPYRQEGNPAAPILIPGMVQVDPFDMSGVTPSLDLAEMKMRQRYAESGFRDNLTSKAGAKGRYQIMPITLQEYTERTGKTGDLMDASFNEGIRDWYMDTRLPQFSVMKRGNPTDLVREYRRYAAYNMGPGALNKALTKAEKDGVDIDNTTDWVSYLPKETRDYVSFIVGGQDVADSSKTRLLYEAAKRLRGVRMADGGKIHIAKNKRGTFTAAAKKHGKSVQAFASQVLANKENYSPAMIKKANFARNSRKWKRADGGDLNIPDGVSDELILQTIRKIRSERVG